MTKRTWKPTTAGVLSILAGVLGGSSGIVGVLIATVVGWGEDDLLLRLMLPDIPLPLMVLGAIATPLIIAGIVAIVGGIFALKRRIWGLALAGAISAVFPCFFLGIPAIIFVVMGKDEFEQGP